MSFLDSYQASAGGAVAALVKALDDAERAYTPVVPVGGAVATMVASMVKTLDSIERMYTPVAPIDGAVAALVKALGNAERLQVHFPEYVNPDLAAEEISSAAIDRADASNIGKSKKLSNREIAIWLTLITCMILNLSLLAINRDSRFAPDMALEGINPFEGATVPIPLIYWAWMAYLNRSSDS